MKLLKLFIAVLLFTAFELDAQVSVIANKNVSETIDKAKVGNIYSLTMTKWADGTKIVVFDNSGSAKDAFYTGIGKDHLSVKKEWMRKQLTGEAKAPETVGSDDDVLKKVATTPGAIGFINSSSVNSSVKVITELK